MKTDFRFWQKVQFFAGVFLLADSWFTGNIFLCAMALLCAGFSVVALLSPTPDQRVHKQIALLQQQGIYPQQGQATDEDVRRVLRAGHKLFAIRLYRELHNVPLKEAIEAVKQLA